MNAAISPCRHMEDDDYEAVKKLEQAVNLIQPTVTRLDKQASFTTAKHLIYKAYMAQADNYKNLFLVSKGTDCESSSIHIQFPISLSTLLMWQCNSNSNCHILHC